jgi:CheY-like chemotaxis protein
MEQAAARVLIVDDNADAADTLAMLLDLSGYQTRVAYAPHDALRDAAAFEPQVAILDIGLPGMSGYDLARALRTGPPPYQGRLVALSGYGQQQDVSSALAAGFDAHLTKPVAPDALLQLLADWAAPPSA